MDSTAVYLEDVLVAKASQQEQDEKESTSASSTSTPSNSQKAATTSAKRQRTLVDMFAGGGSKKPSEPVAKKARISDSEPTTSIKVTGSAPTKASGFQKLNSIPFSMSAYRESLTEEQKELLALECDVMGKSW
jgi:uracil-DNA glycosylase